MDFYLLEVVINLGVDVFKKNNNNNNLGVDFDGCINFIKWLLNVILVFFYFILFYKIIKNWKVVYL